VLLEETLVDEAEVGADALLVLVLGRLARQEGAHEAVEVGPRREVAVGTREDDGPHLGVGVDHVPGVGETAQHLAVERVLLVGPVQRQRHHVPVPLHHHSRI
jgi:hypothetical protein